MIIVIIKHIMNLKREIKMDRLLEKYYSKIYRGFGWFLIAIGMLVALYLLITFFIFAIGNGIWNTITNFDDITFLFEHWFEYIVCILTVSAGKYFVEKFAKSKRIY